MDKNEEELYNKIRELNSIFQDFNENINNLDDLLFKLSNSYQSELNALNQRNQKLQEEILKKDDQIKLLSDKLNQS